MEEYEWIKPLGEGTYGSVWRAIDRRTGEIVAIKRLKRKYDTWKECMNLREVKALRQMTHPNIVKLKRVMRVHDVLHLVFENMECSLLDVMKNRQAPFTETEIRDYCFQIFHALSYMHHKQGYFHRDMKPENLLVRKGVVKIGDFGLARKVSSKPPFTEYVMTRWYRAPEILLSSSTHSSAVDMWAMGAIMAELFMLRPLFPGTSDVDEIYKICSIIGPPTETCWSEGLLLAKNQNYKFPNIDGVGLSALLPSACRNAIDLITSLCSWDPRKRPSAVEVLQHPFFLSSHPVPPSLQVEKSFDRTTPPPIGIIVDGSFPKFSRCRFSEHASVVEGKMESCASNKRLSEVMDRLQQIVTVGNYYQLVTPRRPALTLNNRQELKYDELPKVVDKFSAVTENLCQLLKVGNYNQHLMGHVRGYHLQTMF